MAYCCQHCGLPIDPDSVDDWYDVMADHLNHAHPGLSNPPPEEHIREC